MEQPEDTSRARGQDPLGELLDEGDAEINLDAVDSKRLADHLFLDALLERYHRPDHRGVEERVQRALAGLQPQRRRILPLAWATASVTAGLLMALGVWTMLEPTALSAEAVLRHSIAWMEFPRDRRYAITLEGSGPIGHQEATLFVRGASQFAIEKPTLLGSLWCGHDGTDVWIVPPLAVTPVLVGDRPEALSDWLEKNEAGLPFLHIGTVMARLRDHFDVCDAPSGGYAEGDRSIRVLHATRHTLDDELPACVEVLVDADAGTVLRVLLDWRRRPGEWGPGAMVFELADEVERPDDWYRHSAHHAPDRPVRRL
ncbi:MAG: hypothetical protein AB1486_32130 [Planctomycetota bacterium]